MYFYCRKTNTDKNIFCTISIRNIYIKGKPYLTHADIIMFYTIISFVILSYCCFPMSFLFLWCLYIIIF